jgi:hypothetical protein
VPDLLREFFIEHQPTLQDAYNKARRLGWRVEETQMGYIVHGVNAERQTASWPFNAGGIDVMNYLLDHVLSVQLGEEYRLRVYGPDEPADPNEAVRRKHEIREYRVKTYHAMAYKPGWKRLLGL